jgi:hypothetical protein
MERVGKEEEGLKEEEKLRNLLLIARKEAELCYLHCRAVAKPRRLVLNL